MTENKYKDWVFTWNSSESGNLPSSEELGRFLDQEAIDYVFQKEQGEESARMHWQGAFRTRIRLRHSTLLKRFRTVSFDTLNLTLNRMMGSWDENKLYCSKPESRAVDDNNVYMSLSQETYEGKDIKFLEDKGQWFPWQRELATRMFGQGDSLKPAYSDREILWIYDPRGCSGKSKFVKYLCSNHVGIVKVPFGTAAQLRNALISIGKQRVYFMDIPRQLGREESIDALLSVAEDLKNGFICGAFYGKYVSMMFEPPMVVITTNMEFPEDKKTSYGRWTFLEIDKDTKNFAGKKPGPWDFLD